jgi:hypothetical protein
MGITIQMKKDVALSISLESGLYPALGPIILNLLEQFVGDEGI